MNESFKVDIDLEKIKGTINDFINEIVKRELDNKSSDIKVTISEFFDKGFLKNKQSTFDDSLNWVIEVAFRDAVTLAMEELNFKELLAKEIKTMLSNNDTIQKLAEDKVRASLGLNNEY